MKAVLYRDIQVVKMSDIKRPIITNNEALIKVEYAGICGTDLHIFDGLHPRAKAPLVMGHEISGIIEEMNTERKDIKIGDRVAINPLISCGYCLPCREGNPHLCPNLKLVGIDQNGGFEEYVKIKDDKLYKIPNSLPLDLAALIEPVAVAVHAVRKSKLLIGDKVVVIGGGPIGQLVALICRINGASSILLSEIKLERFNFAKKMELITASSKEETIKKNMEMTKGEGADIVYEAVGIQETYNYITELVKIGGKIITIGAANKPIALDMWKVYFGELTLIGVHVYTPKDIEIGIELLNNYPKIFRPFISKIIGLKDLQSELTGLIDGTSKAMKVLVEL
ncbi:MAG: alcohol dehydrogenase catalytic domain-containing protein [Candidatus Atribacteria bacterium]|nr:alcohol dehydrogenase catalytic domain-containing protein [Candidatus Atribacteria bacterium]